MKIIKEAAEQFKKELTSSEILVSYSDKDYDGYPTFDRHFIGSLHIVPVGPFGIIRKIYRPFSIAINNTFTSPEEFPFVADPKYINHIENLTKNLVTEIDSNINLRVGKWDILDYLAILEFELCELNDNFIIKRTEGMEESSDEDKKEYNILHIENDLLPIYDNYNIKVKIKNAPEILISDNYLFIEGYIMSEWIYAAYSLSRYWVIQMDAIDKLLRIIRTRKTIIEKSDDYIREINSLSFESTILWNKSDTDFLELVTALIETKSITNRDRNLSRKDAVEIISNFFNISIKDSESKLTRATNRKKDISPYLTSLKEAFDNYAVKKEEKRDEIRG